jgi:hypothetical protein
MNQRKNDCYSPEQRHLTSLNTDFRPQTNFKTSLNTTMIAASEKGEESLSVNGYVQNMMDTSILTS